MRRFIFALLCLFVTEEAHAQRGNIFSTKAQQEFAQALTAADKFGVPRYTTALLPTCNAANVGALAWDTTTTTLKNCNGTAWSNGGALTFPDITDDGTTVTLNTVSTFKAVMTGAATTNNFFNVTGTLPSSTSANTIGAYYRITSAGSSANPQFASLSQLIAGYTGAKTTAGAWVLNAAAGTSGTVFGANADSTTVGNIGVLAGSNASTAGNNAAFSGYCTNAGAGSCYGSIGVTGSGADSVGVAGVATGGTNRVGVYGTLRSTPPTYPSSVAGLFDNAAVAAPILVALDNTAALPSTGATASWQIKDGGVEQSGLMVLTNGTMTAENQAILQGSAIHSYTWTNAMVVALGGTTAGDISVATLPAKTVVKNAYVVITGTAAGVTTLTVACGRTSASYIDYIVESDAKVAANTVYGDASAERGTNLTGYDLPSYTGTTVVNCHFISSGANLSAVTGSTGRVVLETSLLP